MREIKFRAWDTQYNQWAYFTLGQLVCGEVTAIANRCEFWRQYTGLTDKNGKEIYEGDLVEDIYGHILEVRYFEAGFLTCMPEYSEEYPVQMEGGELESGPQLLTVLGNIHENPELLESNGKE